MRNQTPIYMCAALKSNDNANAYLASLSSLCCAIEVVVAEEGGG